MANFRTGRVAQEIQKEVNDILVKRVKDPRVSNVTITEVKVTGDLQQATIYYSILSEKEKEFTEHLNSILIDAVDGIIDFNIVNYMNGDYNALNILKTEGIDSIVEDLLNIAKPFFNSVNEYNTNNSHRLMLHNKNIENTINVERLHDDITRCFTATIPQHINTININKFSIIKIDVIDDFTNIVKYNESKKVYEEKVSDTIIIK